MSFPRFSSFSVHFDVKAKLASTYALDRYFRTLIASHYAFLIDQLLVNFNILTMVHPNSLIIKKMFYMTLFVPRRLELR